MAVSEETQTAEKAHRTRRIIAVVLLVLFGITLYAGNHAAWLARTVTETDRFIDTLAPLPEDDAVAEALSVALASRLIEGRDVEDRVENLLPDSLGFLALPVTEAVEGVAADLSLRVISSEAFATIWDTTLRITHATVIALLDGGDDGRLVAEEGTVYLDLTALAERVDEALTERGFDVIDMDTVDARIVLLEGEQLGFAQNIADIIYEVRWGAILATLVLLIATIAVAVDRRRAVKWIGVTSAIVMLLTIIELRYLHGQIVESISDPLNQEAASNAWRILWDGFVVQTIIILVVSVLVALTAWAFGPSPQAVALRSAIEGTPSAAEPGFVVRNLRPLQWSTIGVGILILLVTPTITGVVLLAVGVGVAVVVAALSLTASRRSTSSAT